MNRNSLFGTTLERISVDSLPSVKNECRTANWDIKEPVKGARTDYEEHRLILDEIEKKLKLKKIKATYKRCENLEDCRKLSQNYIFKSPKQSKELFNKIAEESTQSSKIYNTSLTDVIDTQMKQIKKRKFVKDSFSPSYIVLAKSGFSIPRNICHQYKYEVCDNLIKNDIFWTKQNSIKSVKPLEYKKNERISSQYNSIGVILRSNMFPPSIDDNQGTNYVKDFNGWKTFRRRDLTLPIEYKVRKDDISKWSEANIVKNRLYKDWQIKYDETVKNKTVV